jgi:disulfide bond formation protein DsbB
MVARLRPLLDRWPLAALIASAAMLGIAHAFERFGGLAPCTLCLRQREVYWVAGAVAAASLLILRLTPARPWRVLANGLLAAVFAVGVGVAAYHAGAEWGFWPGPSTCSASGAGSVSADELARLMRGETVKPPACDKAAWVFAGLSMAGWNALISAGLAALSLAAARTEASRR